MWSGGAGGADGSSVDREVVRVAGPAAVAPDDIRPGVVFLDQVRLHRPKRRRCHRRADRASHGASSKLPNNRRCEPDDRAANTGPFLVGARMRQRRIWGARIFYQRNALLPSRTRPDFGCVCPQRRRVHATARAERTLDAALERGMHFVRVAGMDWPRHASGRCSPERTARKARDADCTGPCRRESAPPQATRPGR